MNDLYIHALFPDMTSEKCAQGFLGIKDSKYYDPTAAIEDVEKGIARIGSTPNNWIGEISDDTKTTIDGILNLVGDDFPVLDKNLVDQIIEFLNSNYIKRKTVRGTSPQLISFLEKNLGQKICLYAW